MKKRALQFGVWTDTEMPSIDPVEYLSGRERQAVQSVIAQHGSAGEYQFVALLEVDLHGQVLFRAEDLLEGTPPPLMRRSGLAILIGYYESEHEAKIDKVRFANPAELSKRVTETIAINNRFDDYLYLGAVILDNEGGRAGTVFTVENFEDVPIEDRAGGTGRTGRRARA